MTLVLCFTELKNTQIKLKGHDIYMYIASYSRFINRNVDTCIKFIAQDTFLE
jgi:hypothetical protein